MYPLYCWLLSVLLLLYYCCCCRTMKLLQQAGCRVELKSLPGKGHSMINSAAEMQVRFQTGPWHWSNPLCRSTL